MPFLRDKAHDGFLYTFSTRTSATAAGFARSSQLRSSSASDIYAQSKEFYTVRQGMREGGMDRPSQHKSHPAGSLSFSQTGGPPCWVISLAFGVIGRAMHTTELLTYSILYLYTMVVNVITTPRNYA
jgi:hypothetical protein